MTHPFVDTDIIIRLLTNDDPVKQAAAAALFEQIEQGQLTVTAPDTVIADAVYVLISPKLYNLSRDKVCDLLTALLRLPGFRLQNRKSVLTALSIFGTTSLDFGDAMIIATMEDQGAHVLFSYDEDFDQIQPIERKEPKSTASVAA